MTSGMDQNTTREPYRLDDRYAARTGHVFMTGTQALVRIVMEQARRDHDAGLNTAGFVTGYRGSPLGAVDQEMWRSATRIAEIGIKFLPAVNEDLAATAALGSQQVESHIAREVEGVFTLWYGKGPGVDRAGDALKHGNAYGSSPHGGVLVVAGDDHGCVSSSMSHQSDVAFMAWFMPTLPFWAGFPMQACCQAQPVQGCAGTAPRRRCRQPWPTSAPGSVRSCRATCSSPANRACGRSPGSSGRHVPSRGNPAS
jgi:hypothetical protein